MVDHIYDHTIWPYIWPYNVRLNFWLYGILPYIWLATMYMATNHIIWFQAIYMVIYLVWESTRNSKSADIQVNSRFFERNDNSEVLKDSLSFGLFQSTYIPVICEITDAKYESLPLPVNIVES